MSQQHVNMSTYIGEKCVWRENEASVLQCHNGHELCDMATGDLCQRLRANPFELCCGPWMCTMCAWNALIWRVIRACLRPHTLRARCDTSIFNLAIFPTSCGHQNTDRTEVVVVVITRTAWIAQSHSRSTESSLRMCLFPRTSMNAFTITACFVVVDQHHQHIFAKFKSSNLLGKL
jgi:hypothetical protein